MTPCTSNSSKLGWFPSIFFFGEQMIQKLEAKMGWGKRSKNFEQEQQVGNDHKETWTTKQSLNNIITTIWPAKHVHMSRYIYQNEKQMEFIPAFYHIRIVVYHHYCFSLVWLEWYEVITKPKVESRKSVELWNNYTKQKKNNKYFWFFDFFLKERNETKQKYFWIFEYLNRN